MATIYKGFFISSAMKSLISYIFFERRNIFSLLQKTQLFHRGSIIRRRPPFITRLKAFSLNIGTAV